MSSRKRITAALVGLILLVVVGWWVRESTGGQPGEGWSIGEPELISSSVVVCDVGHEVVPEGVGGAC